MHQDISVRKRFKLNFFENLFIVYSFFQMFLLTWLWNRSFYKYIFIIYFIYFIIVVVDSKKKYNSKSGIFGIMFVLLNLGIICLNISENGISTYMVRNVFTVFSNIFIIIFFEFIIKNKREALELLVIKKVSVILNLYFFINVPIIIKQVSSIGFMMRFTDGNPLYFDQITGLIGVNGTHRMTFYWVALTLINIYTYQKNKKELILWMMISEIIFMVIISSYCDNTAFYYFFPIILLQFFIKELSQINIKNFVKFIAIILVATACGIYIYNDNQQVNDFFNSRIKQKYEQLTGKSGQKEDEERIVLFKYALEYGDGYKLGAGIGSVTYGDSMLPQHFGMSEISILTYQGGLIYLGSIILLYAYCSIKLLNLSSKFKVVNFLVFLIMAVNYSIMALYTQIFSTFEMIFMVTLILSIFNFKYGKKLENRPGKI
ncbi:hypothetical protein K9O30_18390 [Clostridium bowmanii]|uniref:hypothetical protein n=1 Tax=Clostridium bowmanii TaxID=132925 RepID=UPI001C0AE7A5|nr:hypothetical protein [Clostridium bowmanii]MBU3191208.1 hypothetical protein [Clostridium bowmanii]MCA1075656.1 hypothetical protein [Clostridium bowmanii]